MKLVEQKRPARHVPEELPPYYEYEDLFGPETDSSAEKAPEDVKLTEVTESTPAAQVDSLDGGDEVQTAPSAETPPASKESDS